MQGSFPKRPYSQFTFSQLLGSPAFPSCSKHKKTVALGPPAFPSCSEHKWTLPFSVLVNGHSLSVF